MSSAGDDIVLPPWVEADPQCSMAVSAGAGSGKTTSLVGPGGFAHGDARRCNRANSW